MENQLADFEAFKKWCKGQWGGWTPDYETLKKWYEWELTKSAHYFWGSNAVRESEIKGTKK